MPTGNVTLVAVQQALGDAISNREAASELLADPSAFFRRTGLDLSQGKDAEFNQHFQTIDPDLTNQLSAAKSGQETDFRPPRLSCWACKGGVWAIAVAIVALGAPGVVDISREAEIVILLARFAGLDTGRVAHFISGLGGEIRKGVDAVATAICRWVHSC